MKLKIKMLNNLKKYYNYYKNKFIIYFYNKTFKEYLIIYIIKII